MCLQFKHDRRNSRFDISICHSLLVHTHERKRKRKGTFDLESHTSKYVFPTSRFSFSSSYLQLRPRDSTRSGARSWRILIYLERHEATRELVKRAPIYKINHRPGSRRKRERVRRGGGGGRQRVSEQSPAFCFIKIIDPAASSRVEKKDDREIFPRSGRIFFSSSFGGRWRNFVNGISS